MAQFTEAEIQVLIVLIELAHPIETPNNNFYTFYPKSIEEASAYFKGFREDWSPAYPTLESQGLIQAQGDGYTLTASGVRAAEMVRAERPPIYYWYKEFYTLTATSQAYARFCERLFGRNLGQAGFSDMDQLNRLVEVTGLGPHHRALDLGCGAGHTAEYFSDLTGAHFWGIDYSPEAIDRALARTQSKRHRLNFKVGNLDDLDFPPRSFDTLISIDTLYMPSNLDDTLRQMVALLMPGGQMAIFYTMSIWSAPDSRNSLLPQNTPLGISLRNTGLSFRTWDFSEQTYQHMRKKHLLGQEMRSEFEAEGSLALLAYILAESESDPAPYDPDTYPSTRYLYHVVV